MKRYLMSFLPIITIFFQKMNVITLSKIRSKQVLIRHVNRKRYLTSFLPIIMMIFQKTNVTISLEG